MLKEIKIINYKCFKNNIITFKSKNNVIIGENNAGKSTLLEVIRIINQSIERLKGRQYHSSEIEYGLGIGYKGIYLELDDLGIETENLFFQYEENKITMIAKFNNEIEIHIHILSVNRVFVFATYQDENVKNNKKFKEHFNDRIAILPQISLLKKEERVIQDDRTLKHVNKKLTSQHFRNEMLIYKEMYPEIYQQYIEKISESLKEITFNDVYTERDIIYAIIREREFSIEVGKLGSGVQMWLQMLWFFIKNLDATTLVLDEPDVYLHPELQKRIVKIAKEYNKQLILTTHSIEIISEVDTDEIIILNKYKEKTKFVDELVEVQDILDKLGSSQIVNLVKLEKYNRIICVEGEDIAFLDIWHKKIFPKSEISLKNVPSYKTGGWGSWDFEKSRTEKILKERKNYHIYYIYDRDYHSEEMINNRYNEAKQRSINLHIWNKKEIENYLINVEVIGRLINKDEEKISLNELQYMIETICDELQETVIDQYANELSRQEKGKETATIFRKVQKQVESNWNDWEYKISVISGKELMKRLIKKVKTDYNIQLTMLGIAKEFQKQEVDKEVVEILRQIENQKDFR